MDQRLYIVIVAVIYLATLIGIGFWAQKRASKVTDFLVAGRKLGPVMCACTIAAVQIGAGVIVGGASTGGTYSVWPGMYYALGCGLGCIVAGLFIAGKMRDVEAVVPMDYFDVRFGQHRPIRAWAWASNVPSMLGIFVAQLLACGSILSAFGIPFWIGVVVCAVVILIYASMGGMWSVVVGDTVNIAVIMVGIPIAAIVAFAALKNTGVEAVSAIFGTPFIPEGLFSKFIYMVTPMLLSISVSYDAFLRYQSAKDVRTAKLGCIGGGIITIFIGTMASAIGAAGHILYPNADVGGIFAFTVSSTMSPILAGIVVTAVLAAAMSSGNGLLICMGASFSRDFYNKLLHPEKTLEELPAAKNIARFTIVGACLLGIFFAFKMDNVLDAIILFNYPYMGSMLVPLFAAVLYKGATVKGCFAAMIVGAIIGTGSFLAGIPGPFNGWVNPDMGLMLAYGVSVIVMVIVSSIDQKNRCPMVVHGDVSMRKSA